MNDDLDLLLAEEEYKYYEDNPNTRLMQNDRDDAVAILKKYYHAKYGITYVNRNEAGNHKRIVAEIDVPENEKKETLQYMKGLIYTLNRHSKQITFFYRPDKDEPMKGYIIADTPAMSEKKVTSSQVDKTKESTGLEFINIMDRNGDCEVEAF